jgi:uncharacterized protein (DUF1015 family)
VPVIEPFRGIHYDPLRTHGLSPVIGPPQDLPDLDEAARIIRQHPYHSLRLELGDPDAEQWPSPPDIRSRVFEQWIADGLLLQSEEPVFFVHEHRYRYEGVYHRRLGLFAAAELTTDPDIGFRPHEGTIPENLRYRIELLQQLRLSISPIFTLVRDTGWLGVVLADLVHARPPDLSGHDAEEGIHRVWKMHDPYLIAWIQDLVAERPLYIADGHHRFAAARAFRDCLVEQGVDPGPAGKVLTLIVSEVDPGVSILPIHRGIRAVPLQWDAIETRLHEYFDVECLLKPSQIEPDLVGRRGRRIAESDIDEPEFLMIRHDDQRLLRLKLRSRQLADDLLDDSIAPRVRELDVTVMHRVLLEHVLGIPADDPDGVIGYPTVPEELTQHVIDGRYTLGLFMRNPRIEQVMAVADAGAYMPQKSTNFFPKVPAGLVMYDLG